MGFEIRKESYNGGIRPITLGKGESALTVGGESCYPFYLFEGTMPNPPVIAMEIWDMEPEDWPEPAVAPFKDVIADPAAWARKCVEEYGAQLICLQLKSIDPNDRDASAESAAATVKKVLDAISVPLIVWGCTNVQKDEDVLKRIAEVCQGSNLLLGPVEEKNYKGISAAAMGYGHSLIASSPIDVNLAKQINILLENLGMPMERVVVDPTTGGLGYGLEYTYSVMERLYLAAMTQGDDKLQYPMINDVGNEVWKSKEAKQTATDAPLLGDPERRGILMEAVAAVTYLMAGSNILIMRHPESIRLTKEFIEAGLLDGDLMDSKAITKRLACTQIDFAALAPEPDLSIVEEKKGTPPQKSAEKPAEATAPPAPSVQANAVQKKAQDTPASHAVSETIAQENNELEAQRKAAAEQVQLDMAKQAAKEAAEGAAIAARAKADAEAAEIRAAQKEKEAAEARALAEEEAKKKARAEALALREAEEESLRQQRAKTQMEQQGGHMTGAREVEITITPAAVQLSEQEKIMLMLNQIHRRVEKDTDIKADISQIG